MSKLAERLHRRHADLAHAADGLRDQATGAARARDEDWNNVTMSSSTPEALLQHDMEEMQAIAAALSRMEAGTYGRCASCGEPVGAQRLEVEPTAALCVACKTDQERRTLH